MKPILTDDQCTELFKCVDKYFKLMAQLDELRSTSESDDWKSTKEFINEKISDISKHPCDSEKMAVIWKVFDQLIDGLCGIENLDTWEEQRNILRALLTMK